MPGPASILRELHRLRRHTTNLQTEIERAPHLIEAQKRKVARQEEILHETQESLKKVKVSTLEKESTLKSTYQQIAKHQKQLNEVEGKKQYDALQSEIVNDRKTCQKLEEEILAAMADADESAARLPELEKAVKQAREECRVREGSTGTPRRTGRTAQPGTPADQGNGRNSARKNPGAVRPHDHFPWRGRPVRRQWPYLRGLLYRNHRSEL